MQIEAGNYGIRFQQLVLCSIKTIRMLEIIDLYSLVKGACGAAGKDCPRHRESPECQISDAYRTKSVAEAAIANLVPVATMCLGSCLTDRSESFSRGLPQFYTQKDVC